MCSIAFGASTILSAVIRRWGISAQLSLKERLGQLGMVSTEPAGGQITDLPDKNIFNYFAASGINTLDCESSQ